MINAAADADSGRLNRVSAKKRRPMTDASSDLLSETPMARTLSARGGSSDLGVIQLHPLTLIE